MNENPNVIETLIESATEYSKTSFELGKLKVLDKTSDAVSTIIPHSIVVFVVSIFILFVNLGLAFWLGEILGKIYFGFLAVAGFYFVVAFVLHFLMHKWIKKIVSNYIIKKVLN